MIRLLLPEPLRLQIEGEARAAFPRECCGLIEGFWSDGGEAQAVTLHPAANSAAADDRFEIEPQAQFAALKAARAAGHLLIGCYHSHPNGVAAPSARDLAGGAEDNFLWLIAALADRHAPLTLAGFVYCAEGFGEIGMATGADLVTSSSYRRN
jgi:proteasome lid subunit RPN8/RPN11